MNRSLLLLLLVLVGFAACQTDKTKKNATVQSASNFSLAADHAVVSGDLKLVPIVSDEATQTNTEFLTMAEALQTPGFRILEQKQLGRQLERSHVNTLTVSNKTDHAIYLMTGEVMRGGNQDRVLAEDQIIAARSLRNVPVFCVEHGRWSPLMSNGEHETNETTQNNNPNKYAFTQHGHMIAGNIRRSIYNNADQQQVWDQVATTTESLDAKSSTGAYAAIEKKADLVQTRQDFLLKAQSQAKVLGPKLRGFAMYKNNKLIAADLFGSADLCSRQIPAIVGGYLAEGLRPNSETVPNFGENRLLEWAENATQGTLKETPAFYDSNKRLLHAGL